VCGDAHVVTWPIVAVPGLTGFAPHGRVTFLLLVQQESNQRKRTPGIRVSLRETSLAPVPLRGPAYKGHPWPFKPLAASMRLVPLRNTSTRPPDGTGLRACKIVSSANSAAFVLLILSHGLTDDAQVPGRVESPRKGLSGMDAARAAMGQGWPFAACPWSGDGMREPRRSRGRMMGCVSLLTFFAQAKKVSRP
jgi:hypothetical protein